MSQDRYPGAKPFQEQQAPIFFGRQAEAAEFHQLIRQEPLVVLYGKSGQGKSSLLNAGLIPQVRKGGHYLPLPIRFLAYTGAESWPVETAAENIRKNTKGNGDFLSQLIEADDSLWRRLKAYQLAAPPGQGMLLIFDQFEELFTYPPQAQLQFRRELAEALYTPLPQRYWDVLGLYGSSEQPLEAAQLARLQEPLNLRVVLAIRQDRIHLLGNLSDYLPSISKHWYELKALSRQSALAAIVEPAAAEGDFYCPPFEYTPEALEEMLDFLSTSGREQVEGTQLQIVCNAIEQRVKKRGLASVDQTTLGSLGQIIEDYYDEKIGAIPDAAQQLAARRLIEEGLIFEEEERRLSLYEGQVLQAYGIWPETLSSLVDSHLLRAEPSLRGGYTYELSHDTLVPPILKAKAERLEADRRKAEEAARQEQGRLLEAERRKRRRARWIAFGASLLAVLAFVMAGWAFVERNNARDNERKAEEALKSYRTEEIRSLGLEIQDLSETVKIYQEAGYKADARLIQDSIAVLENRIEELNVNWQE